MAAKLCIALKDAW